MNLFKTIMLLLLSTDLLLGLQPGLAKDIYMSDWSGSAWYDISHIYFTLDTSGNAKQYYDGYYVYSVSNDANGYTADWTKTVEGDRWWQTWERSYSFDTYSNILGYSYKYFIDGIGGYELLADDYISNTYNDDSHLISTSEYSSWLPPEKYKVAYNYDLDGRIFLEHRQDYTYPDWYDNYKVEWTWDGMTGTGIRKFFNTGEWFDSHKYVRQIDSNNQTIAEERFVYNSGNWVKSEKDTVIYDLRGNPEQVITQNWNESLSTYINCKRKLTVWFYNSAPSAGTGTEYDPYIIQYPENLEWIADNPTKWDKYYIQTADIDISSINKGTGWIPIGNTDIKFSGHYDGQGCTLTGLYINRPAESGIGLFGRTLNAELKNINLTNVNVVGSASTGGLAGYIETTVVTDCSVTGSVTGADNTGGLIGMSLTSSEIKSCSSFSTVTGTKYAGGLCGYNTANSVISNSFSLGDVNGGDFAGGFLGCNNNSAIVNNCYSAGAVSGSGTKGGFVVENVNDATVNGSFWDLNTSGQTESAGGTGNTTPDMQTMTTYTDAGWDFIGESANGTEDIWNIGVLQNYGYPYIASLPVGIENNEAVISDFQLFQNYPNPFNPVTTISYALPKAAQVELNVYNLNGQLVQSLVNGNVSQGIHKAEFNGADLTSGMYIYNLKVDGKAVQSKKMMLLK